MTRTAIPLYVDDISAFARSLHQMLSATPGPLGHLALLNVLARGAGFRNFQHLRAQTAQAGRIAKPPEPQSDPKRIATALRYFDGAGKMARWPSKTNVQHLCMWALWSRLPARESLTERQISLLLNDLHQFGDAALLRRTLIELGLFTRTPEGSIYHRCELPPPSDALALIAALHERPEAHRMRHGIDSIVC